MRGEHVDPNVQPQHRASDEQHVALQSIPPHLCGRGVVFSSSTLLSLCLCLCVWDFGVGCSYCSATPTSCAHWLRALMESIYLSLLKLTAYQARCGQQSGGEKTFSIWVQVADVLSRVTSQR